MNVSRLAWPEDRRLFRRGRKLARVLPAFALAAAAALLLAIGWSGMA